MKIKAFLSLMTQELCAHDTAKLEAEMILSHVLGVSRTALWARPENEVTLALQDRAMQFVQRRVAGEPMAYILNEKEFWGLTLKVTKKTLIPRPETELLVETILNEFPTQEPISVLDLGTGSGAIALALGHERPRWNIIAADRSQRALEVAKDNAVRCEIANVKFIRSDWFEKLSAKKPFDVIVSNPPYIPEGDIHLSQGDVRFEPAGALVSGVDGMDAITHITKHAKRFLKPDGFVLFEHGHNQADLVQALFKEQGYSDIVTLQDLANLDRVTLARRQ